MTTANPGNRVSSFTLESCDAARFSAVGKGVDSPVLLPRDGVDDCKAGAFDQGVAFARQFVENSLEENGTKRGQTLHMNSFNKLEHSQYRASKNRIRDLHLPDL